MKIFLLLIILNYSIFASENVNINKNLTKISEKQEIKSNEKDDNLKELISEEVKNQIEKNNKDNLTLVYNIDQIYQNANNFYTTAFNHLLWLIGSAVIILGFFKWRENLKIKQIEKNLQESKDNLDNKILIAETTYLENLENKKLELLLEMNQKIIENTEITNNNIATNEFIRDLYDFDREKEEEKKKAILDKTEEILETSYKNLDWKIKLEFFKRKIIYYEKKDKTKTLEIFEEIFNKYGYNEETYKIRGDYYFYTKQFILAKENYLRVLSDSKEKSYIYLQLGEIENNLNKLESAKNYYELALKEEIGNAYIITLIGKIEEKLNNLEVAKEYYKKAIQNAPSNSYYWSLLGGVEEKLNSLEEAKKCYKKAVEESSSQSFYLRLLGGVEEKLNNLKEAKECYKKAILQEPNDAHYWNLLGLVEEKLNNLKEAKECYQKATYNDLNNAYSWSLLGEIEEKLNNLEVAKECYKKATYNASENAYYWSQLGRIEEQLNNLKEAEECYQKSVINSSNTPYYWNLLGGIEEKLGNLENAKKYYRNGVDNLPTDSCSLSLLGKVEEELGNLEEAKKNYEEALNNSLNNSYYLSLLGGIEEKLGNFKEAKGYYKKALDNSPNNITYLSLLGKVEEKLNNLKEAVKIYKKIAIESFENKVLNCEKIIKLIDILEKENKNIEIKQNIVSKFESKKEEKINLLLILLMKYQDEKVVENSFLKIVLEELKDDKQTLVELSNYFLNRNIEIAYESLKQYLKIEKENIDVNVFNNLGVLEERKGAELEAIKYYIKAIEKDPEYVLAYYNKAHLYITLKNYDDALIDLNKALKINKRKNLLEKEVYEKTLILLASVYGNRKNYLNIVLLSEELYELNKKKEVFEKNEINYNDILEKIKEEKISEAENHLNIKFLKLIEKNIEKIINLK